MPTNDKPQRSSSTEKKPQNKEKTPAEAQTVAYELDPELDHLDLSEFDKDLDPESEFDKDNEGNTPLHLAIFHHDQERVLTLLENGANPHISNNKGETPLDLAIQTFNVDIIFKLLERGVNPSLPTAKSENPLNILMKKMINPRVNAPSSQELEGIYLPHLESLFQTLSENYPDNKIYQSAQNIFQAAQALHLKIWSSDEEDEAKKVAESAELKRFLSLARKVIAYPNKAEPAEELAQALAEGAPGKPSRWKEMLGALATLAGTALKSIHTFTGIPSSTRGEKLFRYGQDTIFHHKQYRQLYKGLDKLAHFKEEPPASPKAKK
ncbi:MAG: ankyrin repeat protein [Gammaproteobacteria bacterium]|jgi:hypothetical protein|nr:ankyrin repeat protein [Gammaproteobacteria bacterium]